MQISGRTKIVGLFGWPIEHTFSPIIHNAAFEFLGLDYIYYGFGVTPENLSSAVKALVPLGIKGVNITIPHKESVIPLLDSITSEAELIGAVNTINVDEQEKLIGYNTDGMGFITALLSDLNITCEGKEMLILGAGGGARAVGIQSALSGAKTIYVMDIDSVKSDKLSHDILKSNAVVQSETITLPQVQSVVKTIDILVNATPIGMKAGDPLIIQPDWFRSDLKVFDLIYNPLETNLVRVAKQRGCQATNGLSMLIEQGAASFEIWTGVQPPIEIMRQAILNYLTERNKNPKPKSPIIAAESLRHRE